MSSGFCACARLRLLAARAGRNADISLARKVLKWEPQVSLEEGLAKTYKWIAERFVTDQMDVSPMKGQIEIDGFTHAK